MKKNPMVLLLKLTILALLLYFTKHPLAEKEKGGYDYYKKKIVDKTI